MLDVMRNPPPVEEVVVWHAARVKLPDSDETVHVRVTDAEEVTWLGYWDDGDQQWKDTDGAPIGVTWWATMLRGPDEPGSDAPVSVSRLVEEYTDQPIGFISHVTLARLCTPMSTAGYLLDSIWSREQGSAVIPLFIAPVAEEDARDATRYRFLRALGAAGIQVYDGLNDRSIFGDELDAAIDRELAVRARSPR